MVCASGSSSYRTIDQLFVCDIKMTLYAAHDYTFGNKNLRSSSVNGLKYPSTAVQNVCTGIWSFALTLTNSGSEYLGFPPSFLFIFCRYDGSASSLWALTGADWDRSCTLIVGTTLPGVDAMAFLSSFSFGAADALRYSFVSNDWCYNGS